MTFIMRISLVLLFWNIHSSMTCYRNLTILKASYRRYIRQYIVLLLAISNKSKFYKTAQLNIASKTLSTYW